MGSDVGNTTWDYLFSNQAYRAIVKKTVNEITNKTVTKTKSDGSGMFVADGAIYII